MTPNATLNRIRTVFHSFRVSILNADPISKKTGWFKVEGLEIVQHLCQSGRHQEAAVQRKPAHKELEDGSLLHAVFDIGL